MRKTSISTRTENVSKLGNNLSRFEKRGEPSEGNDREYFVESVRKIKSKIKADGQIKIGNFHMETPFLMAPLAGVTDAPTRLIYGQMGAALVYSEMVSAKGMHYGDKHSEQLLDIYPDEGPVAFQIFGSDPEIMAEAAKRLNDRKNVVVDVNMGCPVPKIYKNGDGSALMKNPKLCEKIIEAMVKSTSKPVTAKIRLGIDDKSINCVEVAKAVEAGGASAVCVHGRTRADYYSGKVNYSWIKRVKNAVQIPVIGNGDIFDLRSCIKMFKETDVDMVMIGRGALGNPWIFCELNAWWNGEPPDDLKPSKNEIKLMMKEHTKGLLAYKGEIVAVNEMKKHLAWYTKGHFGSNEFRRKINTLSKVEDLIDAIDNW